MKKNFMHLCMFIGFPALLTSAIQDGLLNGWVKSDKTNSYEITVEKGSGQDGKNCATIKSVRRKIDGYGSLSQKIQAKNYIDRKIHMSGYIKTKNVKGSAHFWMRVDDGFKKESLRFDGMYNRAISGTTDWKKYDIVLEVPYTSKSITYGAMLRGTGQMWFDNINIELAPDSMPTTNNLEKPVNLNFED